MPTGCIAYRKLYTEHGGGFTSWPGPLRRPSSGYFDRRQHQKDGQQQQGGVLGGEGDASRQSAYGHALPASVLYEAVERIDRREETAGCADVCGGDRRVGQDGRIEDKKCYRDHGGTGPEHFATRQEEEQGQHQRKHKDSHVRAEQQRVGAVVSAILRVVAEEQLTATEVCLRLEVPALAGSCLQVQRQQRQCCDELDQGRIFGNQGVLALLPGHVTGIDVATFVPAGGLLAGGEEDFNGHQQEECDDGAGGPSLAVEAPHGGEVY
jgi:hypothetical protein